MLSWYVAKSRRLVEGNIFDVIWEAEDFESEEAARAYASRELQKGQRMEAGTLPGVSPPVRVCWREVGAWALAS